MSPTQVALAGATGNLGVPILEALLDADFHVTVLSRKGGNSFKLKAHSKLTIKEVDFKSTASLTQALLGVDIVIACLATIAIGTQNPLIDASVAAGVKRYIPAEFGMDSQNPLCVKLPVCVPKAETQRYLVGKSIANPDFTYTAIANGLFLDWGIKMGIIVDVAQHTATLYNGGDVPFSATNLADIVKAVLGVIRHQAETANRVVYVHSARVTQNSLIQYAKDKDGKEWKTIEKDTTTVMEESLAELEKGDGGDVAAAMRETSIAGSGRRKYTLLSSSHLPLDISMHTSIPQWSYEIAMPADTHALRVTRRELGTNLGTLLDGTTYIIIQWVKSVKKKSPNPQQDLNRHSPKTWTDFHISGDLTGQTVTVSGSESDHLYAHGSELRSTEPLNLLVESANVRMMQWSEHFFHQGFGSIFGLLVGRYGCPLVDNPIGDICVPATQLFEKLDAYMDEKLDYQSHGFTSEAIERKKHQEDQTVQSLQSAIRSFTARWLPLVTQGDRTEMSQAEEIIKDSWRTARKDMLKVINRTSYRSVLTLYLFAETPTPTGISEQEEQDGISQSICMQTALLQVQQLRGRLESRQSAGLDKSAWSDATACSSQSTNSTQAYLDLESRAYWAAVMWDTSSSLTSSFRTSLTSGLKGGCSEPAWRVAKSFLVGSFHYRTEHLRTANLEVTDEVACEISSAATTCVLYVWKNIASLKEAFREGVDEATVIFVWKAVLDANDIFQTSIHPLLSRCEKRLHFLDQVSRLSWYKVITQYHLGILILADTIEAAGRSDLLPGIAAVKEEAEHEAFNVLKFGIESTYIVYGSGEDTSTAPSIDSTGKPSRPSITVSLVAVDPCPHNVVDLVKFMNKVITRKCRQGKMKPATFSYLQSILLDALKQLPQSSKLVQVAWENLQR
ncbi:Nn.00g097700.m01.CDS01 [Neocucurbitaria sp. VM-36]